MFKVGEYIAFKPDLVLDEKYGTVTYSKWLDVYSEDVLKVVRITTAGTACCVVVATRHTNNLKKEVSTIHESMIVRPKFNIGDSCYIKENFLKELFKAGGICQSTFENLIGTKIHIIAIKYYPEKGFVYSISKIIPNILNYKSEILECNLTNEELDYDLLDILLNVNENENRLQEQEVAYSRGESIEGSGVHGESLQSKISSGCLGDSKGIRGS
jgi:hypothetical protein